MLTFAWSTGQLGWRPDIKPLAKLLAPDMLAGGVISEHCSDPLSVEGPAPRSFFIDGALSVGRVP
jgi:hypothetical protein